MGSDDRRRAGLGWLAVAAALSFGGLPRVGTTATAPPRAAPSERRVTLFYTAEVHGAVEPCGCTSDPLGDVSRLAALISDARRGGAGVALVDGGGLLYPEGKIAAKERPSADLRAEFLAAQFDRMGLLGAALADTDAIAGAGRVRPARLASNLTGAPTVLRPPRVENVGGISIGLLGVAEPAVAGAVNAKPEDLAEAARRDVAGLRASGAEIVVLLAAVDKAVARRLARDSGANVVVLGKRVGAGMPRLEKVGTAFLVAPAEEMQRVGRLDIVLRTAPGARGPLDLQDGGGPEAAALRRDEIDRALERLRVGLKTWAGPQRSSGTQTSGDDTTDAAFVAAKKREVAELEAERTRLEAAWAPPAGGDYVMNTLVPLRRSLRQDRAVIAAMKKLDQRVAAVNLKQATPPTAPEVGRPFYVGTQKCAGCHKASTAFWKQTGHSHAWKTLVDGGKQADYKCIGCHVTGFGQVGGATLGFTKKLESVQCETCHGPGSQHVTGEGNEEPLAIKRDTPETVCLGCHTEEHSDTFQFEAYMRDVVGPGHGAKQREKLGPGPTGRELRKAALLKAKLAGAAQLKTR